MLQLEGGVAGDSRDSDWFMGEQIVQIVIQRRMDSANRDG
jgi:hypothetical protein